MMCGLFNIFKCKSASKKEPKQEKQETKKGNKLLRKSKSARTTPQAAESPVTGVVYGPLTKRQSETLALRVEAFGNENSAQENMQNAGDGRFESEATVVGKWESPDVWLVEKKKPAAAK